jgi:hypothetical protein
MKNFLASLVACAALAASLVLPAAADTTPSLAVVVSSCGILSYPVGKTYPETMDPQGRKCVLSGAPSGAATPTDRSGTLTTGGTSQTLAAANSSRKCLFVQNPATAAGEGIATAEDLYINNNAVAAVVGNGANYADLSPGASATLCFSGIVDQTQITVNAATISHRWYGKEY